jgi:lipopolysaccharide transport system ATP-binding protein
MSDIIIRAENVGKRYVLNHQANPGGYTKFSDVLINAATAPLRWLQTANREQQTANTKEDFWALKDVSFEIKRGDVVGIIGRNGAGKSTLLKILSRITEPTTGRITLNGRIASLLEVGTGFHPELTGRENIFLNGAILGMSKAEIKSKFDEIVAFAEIEKFLDTPVKRYSSGMYVRLAFAVAAHLEPEILIVDEVLAVGDAAFQKKCLGKMQDVAQKGGRTVLFVSHNMAALSALCSRGLFLNNGFVHFDGATRQAVETYLSAGAPLSGEVKWEDHASAPGNERVFLNCVRIVSEGATTTEVIMDRSCNIEIEYTNLQEGLQLNASVHLLDKMGVEILASANFHSANLIRDEWGDRNYPVGRYRTICTIPANFLNECQYTIRVALVSNISTVEILTGEIIGFSAQDTGEMRKQYLGAWIGLVRPKLAWQTTQISETKPSN